MKIDPDLYSMLKLSRDQCNQTFMKMLEVTDIIKTNQFLIYTLGKKIRGQPLLGIKAHSRKDLLQSVSIGNTIIQGIDPGIVTTATGISTLTKSPFQSINRYQAISDTKVVPHPLDHNYEFDLTTNMINTVIMPTQDRKQREAKTNKEKREKGTL